MTLLRCLAAFFLSRNETNTILPQISYQRDLLSKNTALLELGTRCQFVMRRRRVFSHREIP